MRVYYKQKFSDFVPPDMGCEQPRTDAEEITFSVMREMLYFDTRFERKNYCERYTRELESAAEAGCGYAWLLLGWFFSEQPSAFRCSTEVPTVEECFKKAELYYKKAVEAGENAARTLLGKLYIFGCGGARVYSENRVEEALEQLELAAEGGDASAAELLAAVYGNDVYDESPFDVQWMLEMGVLKPEFLVEGEDGELYVAPEGLGLVNLGVCRKRRPCAVLAKKSGSSRQGKNGKLKAAPDRLLRAYRFIDLIII